MLNEMSLSCDIPHFDHLPCDILLYIFKNCIESPAPSVCKRWRAAIGAAQVEGYFTCEVQQCPDPTALPSSHFSSMSVKQKASLPTCIRQKHGRDSHINPIYSISWTDIMAECRGLWAVGQVDECQSMINWLLTTTHYTGYINTTNNIFLLLFVTHEQYRKYIFDVIPACANINISEIYDLCAEADQGSQDDAHERLQDLIQPIYNIMVWAESNRNDNYFNDIAFIKDHNTVLSNTWTDELDFDEEV